MKVFTHYTKLGSTSDGIRWRTILKFGNSWEVKGSVVMKNPGAANFKRPDHAAINSPEELKLLSVFDDGEFRADWYEFSSDPTMECIGRLFSEYYAAKGELLEGVIQIFNLFYFREANLITALNKVSQLNLANMVDYDVQHLTFPVYLGFADLAWHKTYGVVARKFFNAAKKLGALYLNDDFKKNAFIHPLYLMMYGKNKEKCIRAKYQFFQNTPTPVVSQKLIDDAAIESIVKINNNAIMMKITTALNEQFPLVKGEERNHRYIFDDIIELTVTDKEQGFVGFRHLKNGKCYYNYTNQDAPNEYLYRDILSDYGFDTEKNIGNNVWLARKAFKEYGSDEQDVTRNILEELKNLRNRFNHMKIVGNNNNHMNKKIYFAGSIRGGRGDAYLYQRMIDYIKQTDTVLTEHIGKTNMSLKAQTKAIDIHIYERDIEWLKQSDMVIAECTCPSLGVGYELAYAEAHNIPVYIFYDKSNANISAMLNGNEYFNIIPYESEDEIYHNLDNILHC